jgi:hypothetical protein
MGFHIESPAGPVTLAALTALIDRLEAVAAADPGARILLDESEMTLVGIGAAEVQRLASRLQDTEHLRHARVAVVAPDSTIFGISRMGIAYAEAGRTIRIFRERAEAEAWLSL